jgi:hypothetical protein
MYSNIWKARRQGTRAMAVSLINRGLLTPCPHLEMVLGAALPGGEDESEDRDEVGEYAGEFEFDKDGSATED